MSDKRIVVVQSGWVFIGDFFAKDGDLPAHLTNAKNIRFWGTTSGLGEIALKGPTKETVLDECGIVVFDNEMSILFTIPCEV